MGEAIKIDRGRHGVSAAMLAMFGEEMAKAEGTFAERETRALALSNELVRCWIEGELQQRADVIADEVIVDEQRYRRHSEGTARYHTLCGAVVVRRGLYRLVGVHNGATVVPLELEVGIWENATPALAFSVTQGFASRPLREYELEMAAAHRDVPSRSTLERIGKRIGTAIDDVIAENEPWIRAAEARLEGVHSISLGLDRTTVPMAEPIPGAPMPEPRVRRRPQPVAVAYRMAYVGTVSLHDERGGVLVTKRFGATPHEGPSELLDRIAMELVHQQSRYDVPISVIQDGAPELWNLVAEMCERRGITIADEVIDRFHVDERLAQICEQAAGHPAPARELYEAWRYQLDHSDGAIDRIVRHLNALVWHTQFAFVEGTPAPSFWRERGVDELRGDALSVVVGHLEYLRRNRRRIRYASRRRGGLPIGSGATEGACKSLVTVRFKRSGQRWFESGLSPCLSLRALHLSDRLRPAFTRIATRRAASLGAA